MMTMMIKKQMQETSIPGEQEREIEQRALLVSFETPYWQRGEGGGTLMTMMIQKQMQETRGTRALLMNRVLFL